MKKLTLLIVCILIISECIAQNWSITGNSGTNPATNFLGTIDTKDLIIRTDNNERVWFKENGFVGIKANNPYTLFQVGNNIRKFTVGEGNANAPQWWSMYAGFNLSRNNTTSEWLVETDGGSNGGSGIIGDVDGNMHFINVPKSSQSPYPDQVIAGDNDLKNNYKSVTFSKDGKILIGKSNVLQDAIYIGDRFTIHNGGTKIIGYNFRWENVGGPGGTTYRQVDNDYSMVMALHNGTGDISFSTADNVGLAGSILNLTERLKIRNDGKVTIGQNINPGGCMLAVDGLIGARELKVVAVGQPFPDYVFDKHYNLMSLENLEKFIASNNHLPEIPSAAKVKDENGFEVGKMSLSLLKKIEELSLYVIDLNKQIKELKIANDELKSNLKK